MVVTRQHGGGIHSEKEAEGLALAQPFITNRLLKTPVEGTPQRKDLPLVSSSNHPNWVKFPPS